MDDEKQGGMERQARGRETDQIDRDVGYWHIYAAEEEVEVGDGGCAYSA